MLRERTPEAEDSTAHQRDFKDAPSGADPKNVGQVVTRDLVAPDGPALNDKVVSFQVEGAPQRNAARP